MNTEWKSFALGIGFTLAVIAVFAWPYREEIKWAVKNRTALGNAADVGSGLSDLYGRFFK